MRVIIIKRRKSPTVVIPQTTTDRVNTACYVLNNNRSIGGVITHYAVGLLRKVDHKALSSVDNQDPLCARMTPVDDVTFAQTMAAARRGIKKYRNALIELAQ